MTSLAAAVAVDERGPCAMYIITDSRISWESAAHWDAGRKTFASSASADIFGYCGDAYFVPIVLSQTLALWDAGLLEVQEASAQQRHNLLVALLKSSIDRGRPPFIGFSVFHGSRDAEFMVSKFRLWRTMYDPVSKEWTDEELPLLESNSYLAHIDGTGRPHVQRAVKKLSESAGGTSRAAIHSFCKSLQARGDAYSGGPPQLVGIWRKGAGRQFGFCWHGKSYLAGLEVPINADHTQVMWFNHLFEIVDGKTGSKLEKAKSHRASLDPRRPT